MTNGMVAHIPAMFQNALSAANGRPCSRPKKISETTASWGRDAARPPTRGPKRSATAVTATTSPADTTIFARSSVSDTERRPPARDAVKARASPTRIYAAGRVDRRSTLMDSMSTMQDRAAATAPPDINARIAGRVRALRTDLRMTLDALAEKCHVSRSMISLVERGKAAPPPWCWTRSPPGSACRWPPSSTTRRRGQPGVAA